MIKHYTLKRTFIAGVIACGSLGAITTNAIANVNEAVTQAINTPQLVNQQLPSLAPMLEKVLPSVVTVTVSGTQEQQAQAFPFPDEFKFFFGPQLSPFGQSPSAPRQFEGLGSGVIIDAEKGYVLTNNHVVENADEIKLTLNDGREFKAKLLGADELSDVALLQIEKPKDLVAMKIANSNTLRVGDYVVAIGNPFGLGHTVTSGIVSALGRSTTMQGGRYENYIQTDAAVNRGNSGGALINLKGELVGINTAILAPSGGNVGIAFAIPSSMALNLVDQIVEFGEVRRGVLGIKGGELNAEIAQAFDVKAKQGAFVSEVLADSAAEKAGLKAGDVITAVDGQKISSFAELRAKVATTGAGKTISLTLERNGDSKEVTVVLAADEFTADAHAILPALEGAEFTNYDKEGKKGVEISSIKEKSPAERLGLQNGDIIIGINRQPITTLSELRKTLSDNKGVIALHIARGNSNFYLLVQ